MKITDSPYAAGTPEHTKWVREEFIPNAGWERWEEDAAKAGAASIGGKLVREPMFDQINSLVRLNPSAFVTLRQATENARNQFTLFYEEFTRVLDHEEVSGTGYAKNPRTTWHTTS